MTARGRWMILALTTWALLGTATVQAQNWRPALGDADEFYDAAEDLHDRAQKFNDVRVLPLTAELEILTTDLYQLLKNKACPTDVVTTLNAAAATLQQVDMLVTLSCHMSKDRKSMSELANCRKYFDLTSRHIYNALGQTHGYPHGHSHGHSHAVPAVPSWYQAPVGSRFTIGQHSQRLAHYRACW